MPRLDASAWPRIGAVAFAVLAITASALQLGRGRDEEPSRPVREAPASDYLASELERCRTVAPSAPRDDACERAWAESRRRFVGVKAGPAASPPVEMFPAQSQPSPTPAAPAPVAPVQQPAGAPR